MPINKQHSNLRMYAEVRSSFVESVDSLKVLAEDFREKFIVIQENQDELILKGNPESTGEFEIKIAPRKVFFIMSECLDYHHFIKALKTNLNLISHQVTPKEISSIGVEGLYLYPIGSFQEFSQLAFSWTGNYINSQSLMEINDLGVSVFFREGSLKVNLVCRVMTLDQIGDYFPGVKSDTAANLNLFIKIDLSTEEVVKMDSAASHAIGKSIKEHVHQATHMIEERLGLEIGIDSSESVS